MEAMVARAAINTTVEMINFRFFNRPMTIVEKLEKVAEKLEKDKERSRDNQP